MTPVGSADLRATIFEFERDLSAFGLVLPPGGVVADGDIHRIADAQHHRKRNNAGWYVLHTLRSGLVTGWYGSWLRDRGKKRWSSRGQRTFTAEDRTAIAELRAKIDADRLHRYEEGVQWATRMWMAAKDCTSHPYLDRKHAQTYGLRVLDETTARNMGVQDVGGDMLLIPVKDLDGNLRGLQLIGPEDVKDNKDYSLGTDRSSGTCFVIGTLDGAATVAIVEGYATGATVHEATRWPVVVAFDTSGLEKIVKPLRKRLPKATLIFAGDHDLDEKGGEGQKAAHKAARLAGGVVALPPTEGTDWNDHANGKLGVCEAYGLEDVHARLTAAAGIVNLPATLTLADGSTQLDRIIGRFFDDAQAWHDLPETERAMPSTDLSVITMGVGKSRMARIAAGQFLERKAAATVGFALPLHRLTAEQAADFKDETGQDVAIWRGMDQPDPERGDGAKMCLQPELSKAVQVAGASMSSICAVCPSRTECGYRRQRTQKAHAWYIPNQLLFRARPTAIPPIAALVIDEKFHDAGMDQNIPLAASTLEGELLGVPHAGDRELLRELRGMLLAGLEAAAARASAGEARARITKADLMATGLTADLAHEAQRIEWSRKPRPMLSGDVSDMAEALKAMAGRFTTRVPTLWRLVEELLRGDHDVSTSIEIEPEAKAADGSGLVIRMHHRLDVHPSWRCPTLVLDGTAKPEIVQLFFPELHIAPEVHIEAPHQLVTWVRASFAKSRFVPSAGAANRRNKSRLNNIEGLRRFVEAKAAEYRGRGAGPCDMLVVTNEDIEELLLAGQGLPGNVATEHFNNLRGTNYYERVRAVIVIGRTLPDIRTIHRQAERLAGHPLDQDDTLVAAVRWSICEAELLQVIARARGIRRTEANPLDVFVLGDVPLPLKIDRTLGWAEAQPHPCELLAARGLVPDCDTDTKGYWSVVQAVLPDLFDTPDAARVALSREQSSMSNLSIDVCTRELDLFGPGTHNWLPLMAKTRGGRYAVPVLIDPAGRSGLEAVLELAEPQNRDNHATPVPTDRRGPNVASNSSDDIWDEAVEWLVIQNKTHGIPVFEALEIPPDLAADELIHCRMQAEWRDRRTWHLWRHDLGPDVAVRP